MANFTATTARAPANTYKAALPGFKLRRINEASGLAVSPIDIATSFHWSLNDLNTLANSREVAAALPQASLVDSKMIAVLATTFC